METQYNVDNLVQAVVEEMIDCRYGIEPTLSQVRSLAIDIAADEDYMNHIMTDEDLDEFTAAWITFSGGLPQAQYYQRLELSQQGE